jgi:hypothetical protein
MLDLARVKDYLRVDQDFDDSEIEAMISGAFQYFSNETNHIFGKVEKDYFSPFRVYDFPIHNVEDLIKKSNYYLPKDCPSDYITLEVGYETEADIPTDIIQAILQIIKVWYYESEGEENKTLLPKSVMQVIEKYRRFHL